MERRRALDGSAAPPQRPRSAARSSCPPTTAFAEFAGGSGKQAVSTTMAFTRLLRNLRPRRALRPPRRADHPRRGAHLRHGRAVPRVQDLRRRTGQQYEPVDDAAAAVLPEAQDGQILEEGITEAGSMASFTAAGTSYATWGVPMIPFFIFYSMFGFQRVGDLIWAGGRRAGPGLPARRHRRAHHAARRGPAAPGRPQPRCSRRPCPTCRGLRPGVRLRDGRDRPRRHPPHVRAERRGRLLLPHPLQRELPDAADARTGVDDGIVARPLPVGRRPRRARRAARPSCSPAPPTCAARARRRRELAEHYDVGAELWSATSYKRLREEALSTERWNRLHPAAAAHAVPVVTELLAGHRADRRRHRLHEGRARPDRPVGPAGRRFVPLGTDGFGRSDTREALRRHFEIDAGERRGGHARRARPPTAPSSRRSSKTPSSATASIPRPPTLGPSTSPGTDQRAARSRQLAPDSAGAGRSLRRSRSRMAQRVTSRMASDTIRPDILEVP